MLTDTMLTDADLAAVLLTVKLAVTTTMVLLVTATPLAWWLAFSHSRWRGLINAVVALPLVLPPTVIGFYLLLTLSPSSPVGQFAEALGIGLLPFTFTGLVIGSCIYSLPFVVQPIQIALQSVGTRPFEVAATLGAKPIDRFLTVALPLAKPGFISAAVLGFAHTVGEFGVVLMIGGNIPDETKVVSIALYDHVEALAYSEAHALALGLVIFSLIVLTAVYSRGQGFKVAP